MRKTLQRSDQKPMVQRQESHSTDYALWAVLSRTRDMIFRARARDFASIGLPPRQASALLTIASIGEKATPAEIARRMFREPHTVSGLLRRMEASGLIRQTKDLDKRNLIRVTIREKGQQALALVRANETLGRIFSPLSQEQRQQLESILEILLIKAVEELGGSERRELTLFLARLLNRPVEQVEMKIASL